MRDTTDSTAGNDTTIAERGRVIWLDVTVPVEPAASEPYASDVMRAFDAIEDRARRADPAERRDLISLTTRLLDSLHRMAGITPAHPAGRRHRSLDAA